MPVGGAAGPAADRLVATGWPLRLALWLIGIVAALVWVFLTALVFAESPSIAVPLTEWSAVGLGNVCVGLLAWTRRPHNLTGFWLCVTGFLIFIAVTGNLPHPVLVFLGTALGQAPIAAFLHVLLAFPSGRLQGRVARLLAVAGYAVTVGIDCVRVVLVWPGPMIYGFFPNSTVDGVLQDAQHGLGVLVLGAAGVLLASRALATRAGGRDPGERRVLSSAYVWGIGMLWFLPVSANVVAPLLNWSPVTLFEVQVVPFLTVPIVLAAAILRGGFARTGELEELGAWLGAQPTGRPPLRSALAATLGDPSLRVLFGGPTGWLDSDGAPTAPPSDLSPPRGVHLISGPQGQTAAIDYDANLIAGPRLVAAAANVVSLALDRDRLTADLIGSRELIRASRARLVEVADLERRRVAADLHDGLQARLVLAAMHAGSLLHSTEQGDDGVGEQGDGGEQAAVRRIAATIRSELNDAIAELRGLLHGLMPAMLLERGLFAAVSDLVDRVPIQAEVRFNGERDDDIAPALATSCYFIVSEAVTNAVKHSGAGLLTVDLARTGTVLRLRVVDDGCGGAPSAPAAGHGGGSAPSSQQPAGAGLIGLADRVDAFGGTLLIDSPPGGGTSIIAELPCES